MLNQVDLDPVAHYQCPVGVFIVPIRVRKLGKPLQNHWPSVMDNGLHNLQQDLQYYLQPRVAVWITHKETQPDVPFIVGNIQQLAFCGRLL